MAAEDTKYEVAAYLRLKGNFGAQMNRAAASVPKLDRNLKKAQMTANRLGNSLMRGPVAALSRMVKLSAAMAGIGGALAMKGLIGGGFAFNKQMEDARLNLATMFQMFGIADQVVGKAASPAEKWAANIGVASAAMKEFMVLQAQTPAGMQDLVRIYQASAAGLSQANKNVAKHVKFVGEWSLLAGALDGDYQQLGADLGRMMTGQAGAEIRTWQVYKTNILESAKGLKLVNKRMRDGEKWVQKWNAGFTADQRLKVLENMISKAGPTLKKAMGESMSGLLSTTKSTMNSLKGVFTIPMYNEFRLFLKRITQATSGVFGNEAMRDWIKILSVFGGMLGGLAKRWLAALEQGAIYLRENWMEVADSVYRAFQAGALLLKAVLTVALAKLAVGVGARAVGAGIGAAGAGIKGVRKAGGVIGGMRKTMDVGVKRGFLGKGRGITGMIGSLIQKTLTDQNVVAKTRGLALTMTRLASAFAAIMTFAVPFVAVVAALGIAFGVVGIIVAGMAAYVIENWRMIAGEIATAMKSGEVTIRKVLTAAFKLWNGLVVIGQMFLGGGKSVGFMNSMLGFMFDTINMVTKAIIFFLEVGQSLASFWGGLGTMIAKMINAFASIEEFGGHLGMGTGRAEEFRAAAKSWSESAEGADRMRGILAETKNQFQKFQQQGLTIDQEKFIKDSDRSLADWFANAGKPKAKVPVSGVHVENMYNQWDLRNTDPDRLMAAFLPKIEQLADKRTQSYEALDQGI